MNDLIAKLKKQFHTKTVYKWNGYFDDNREAAVVAIIEKAAKATDLAPSFVATIAAGEGLGLWIDQHYAPAPPYAVNVGDSIDGFDHLGIDHFSSDFERTRRYLPKDFKEGKQFKASEAENEKLKIVRSAEFRDLASGIQALAATLRLRRDIFRQHWSSQGTNVPGSVTGEREAFWIYVYFQGEGNGKEYLTLNKGVDYDRASPPQFGQVRQLALERVAAWKYMQSRGIFSS
jgi:hypothetical protein